MCGRFALYAPASTIAEVFGVAVPTDLTPRYNVAPTQQILAVRGDAGARVVERYRWGLVPRVLARSGIPKGRPLINARAETIHSKGIFKYGFRHRRLLIPVDGFFEWRREGKRKTAFHIRLDPELPTAMAGLWEETTLPDGQVVRSCTVITTDANAAVAPIHDRMPVFLPSRHWERWLDAELTDPEPLRPLLTPAPADQTVVIPVSDRVNSVRNDDADCVVPLSDAS
jgi:putative SOS response-associated peptidase YedK